MSVRLSEIFSDLLKRKDPGALVLLARNLSLLQMIGPVGGSKELVQPRE